MGRGAALFDAGERRDAGDCRELAQDRRHIAVLTNNTTLVADNIDALLPELRPLFGARIYASAQFKTAKPDPRCYRLCLSELQVAPETVLFIDDLAQNCAGAREAGLLAHHHTTPEALKQALAKHDLIEAP